MYGYALTSEQWLVVSTHPVFDQVQSQYPKEEAALIVRDHLRESAPQWTHKVYRVTLEEVTKGDKE